MLTTRVIDESLSAALRHVLSGSEAPWSGSSDDEWNQRHALEQAWARIEFHGIAVLLHNAGSLLADWPAPLRERIAEEARLMGLWETTHRSVMTKLLDALAAGGIDSLLMKGTAAAYSLYDDPSARRRGDSDLLIRPADLERAREVLAEAGWYRNSDPHGLSCQEGWLREAAGGAFVHSLDLHWKPADRAALQKVLETEALFATRKELPGLCPSAWRADTPWSVIHEALNQKWHVTYGYLTEQGRVTGGRRLIWSMDFVLLAEAMSAQDWQDLIERCGQSGIGPLVARALSDAFADLGKEPPHVNLQALSQQPESAEIAAFFSAGDAFDAFWVNLRQAGSLKERLALIRDRGFPPRAHLQAKYPAQKDWPGAILQARFLAEVSGRVVRRAFGK